MRIIFFSILLNLVTYNSYSQNDICFKQVINGETQYHYFLYEGDIELLYNAQFGLSFILKRVDSGEIKDDESLLYLSFNCQTNHFSFESYDYHPKIKEKVQILRYGHSGDFILNGGILKLYRNLKFDNEKCPTVMNKYQIEISKESLKLIAID